MREGNCANGADPEMFHPEGLGNAVTTRMRTAVLTYCNVCPVRDKCLRYALDNWFEAEHQGEYGVGKFGVWGGTLPGERASLMRGKQAA
jgi:hypothetical protein